MIYVLYQKSGVHSGRALVRELISRKSDHRIRGGFPKFFNQVCRTVTPELVVNLGATEAVHNTKTFLNDQDMVRSSSNKRNSRKVFYETGVPVPPLFFSASAVCESDLPVIGRTSYHCKGRGFWYCTSMAQVKAAKQKGATHFLGFIPDSREYRVHVFIKPEAFNKEGKDRQLEDYSSIKISEKVWTGEGQPKANMPQRNHGFGWAFRGPKDRQEDEINVVRYAGKEAIAALGLDFGAVDVIYNLTGKRAFVLEVNSAPSLADEQSDTCKRYADKILALLKKND